MFFPKNKPERDPEYLKQLAQEPCCICYPIVCVPRYKPGGMAHHYGKKGKGKGQKCSDYQTVPICLKHHNEVHWKGNKFIQEKYGIDFEKISSYYRDKYKELIC